MEPEQTPLMHASSAEADEEPASSSRITKDDRFILFVRFAAKGLFLGQPSHSVSQTRQSFTKLRPL